MGEIAEGGPRRSPLFRSHNEAETRGNVNGYAWLNHIDFKLDANNHSHEDGPQQLLLQKKNADCHSA